MPRPDQSCSVPSISSLPCPCSCLGIIIRPLLHFHLHLQISITRGCIEPVMQEKRDALEEAARMHKMVESETARYHMDQYTLIGHCFACISGWNGDQSFKLRKNEFHTLHSKVQQWMIDMSFVGLDDDHIRFSRKVSKSGMRSRFDTSAWTKCSICPPGNWRKLFATQGASSLFL